MQFQQVEVVIDRDGEVRIEVHEVAGRAPLDLTEGLLEAPRGELPEQELTAEASEAPEASEWVPLNSRSQR